ncbi:MAG TPA: hypothetical protein VNM72_09595 [Blastocatellia bacterium]|nr:hypothetical protein [Blastocatellia bacterium]
MKNLITLGAIVMLLFLAWAGHVNGQVMNGMGPVRLDNQTVAVGPDGTIYVVTSPLQRGMGREWRQAVLLAVDPVTNGIKWRFSLDDEDRAASSLVVGKDGTVYFTLTEMMVMDSPWEDSTQVRKAELLAVKNGLLKWKYEFDDVIASEPVLNPSGDVVFVTTTELLFTPMPGMGSLGRSRFLALADRGTTAERVAFLDLGVGRVSAPVVGPYPSTSWAIFITGEAFMAPMGAGQATTLFIISPDYRLTTLRLR